MKNIMQLYRDNKDRSKAPVNLVRNESEATIYIYDVIDSYWGVSALAIIDAVTQAGDAQTLHVRINSPGGDVFESRAIMAAIGRFKGKTIAHIDSLAASAATSVALACDEVEMSDGAFFMIHCAMGFAFGDKSDMRETADLLEKVEGAIVNDYTTKTGKDSAEIIAMMEEETWMDANEALANGFVDRIAQPKEKPSNTWNLAAYAKAPAALSEPPKNPENEEPAPEGFFSSVKNANKLKLATVL